MGSSLVPRLSEGEGKRETGISCMHMRLINVRWTRAFLWARSKLCIKCPRSYHPHNRVQSHQVPFADRFWSVYLVRASLFYVQEADRQGLYPVLLVYLTPSSYVVLWLVANRLFSVPSTEANSFKSCWKYTSSEKDLLRERSTQPDRSWSFNDTRPSIYRSSVRITQCCNDVKSTQKTTERMWVSPEAGEIKRMRMQLIPGSLFPSPSESLGTRLQWDRNFMLNHAVESLVSFLLKVKSDRNHYLNSHSRKRLHRKNIQYRQNQTFQKHVGQNRDRQM